MNKSAPARNNNRVTFVLPATGNSGGVRVTVAMANGLIKSGFNVRVISLDAGRISLESIKQTVRQRVNLLPRGNEVDWIHQFTGRFEQVRSINRVDFFPDEFVIAVGSMTVDVVHRLLAPVRKVRYCHGFTGGDPELMRHAWGLPMTTIAVAPGLVRKLEELSGEPVAAVVPNGMDGNEYYPEETGPRLGVGVVLRHHPNKSYDDAIRVIERLKTSRPDLPIYAFGPGRAPTGNLMVDYTRLPTITSARQIYSRTLVWFLTSRYEGFGLPILEAMACGSCVVTSDHDGCEGLVDDGKNGFVVPHGDINAFQARIFELLDDQALRSRFVDAGQRTARHFTWDHAVNQMAGFLDGQDISWRVVA